MTGKVSPGDGDLHRELLNLGRFLLQNAQSVLEAHEAALLVRQMALPPSPVHLRASFSLAERALHPLALRMYFCGDRALAERARACWLRAIETGAVMHEVKA